MPIFAVPMCSTTSMACALAPVIFAVMLSLPLEDVSTENLPSGSTTASADSFSSMPLTSTGFVPETTS